MTALPTFPIRTAARLVRNGAVIAYPTEGVFGLGCRPDDPSAVARLLVLKNRQSAQGLILIAADMRQLDSWIALPPGIDTSTLHDSAEQALTWVIPKSPHCPYWISGDHPGVAVRLTQHPVAATLCRLANSALVSTSANVAGQAPARNAHILRRRFGALVDYIVPGSTGAARGPSEIRDLLSGKILRPGAT